MMLSLLEWLGAIPCAWLAYSTTKFLLALKSSCDFQTAITPKLPKNAFQDQVVWITGASSGIGKEMALLLVSKNDSIHLILSSRTLADLQLVQQECLKLNPKAQIKILQINLLAEPSELQEKTQQAMTLFGTNKPVTVLVNNGGISTRAMASDCSVDVDILVTKIDYLSHVTITKSLLACDNSNLISKLRIINTLSVSAKLGVPCRTAYCGAKFALKGWMDAFRIECLLQQRNVHILNVCLGSTHTNLPNRAVVNVQNDGKVETFQGNDANIQQGLSAKMVAERMLSTSFHESVSECWLAKGKELIILYLNQYIPQTGFKLLVKSLAKQYAVSSKTKVA